MNEALLTDLDIKKPLIVAGNGPSIRDIDYSRLPADLEDCEIFRCNQFYFEDHYWLGDKISGAFFNPSLFFNQFFTAQRLIENNDYKIKNIISNQMNWYSEGFFFMDKSSFDKFYPSCFLMYEIIKQHPKLHGYIKYMDMYLSQRPTSGVLLAIAGAILGFHEIYIVGVDLYKTNSYSYDHNKANISKHFHTDGTRSAMHTDNIDISCLKKVEETFNIKIQNISQKSALEELFPFTGSRRQYNFIVKEKSLDAITDLQLAYDFNPNIPRKYIGNLLRMHEDIVQIKRDLYILINENIFTRIIKHTKDYFKDIFCRLKRHVSGGGGVNRRNTRAQRISSALRLITFVFFLCSTSS